jgi:hypothetical protein
LHDKQQASKHVRHQISQEKSGLEEQEANAPDSGRAAELCRNYLADQRLDLKKQAGAQEDCQSKRCLGEYTM